MRSGRPNVLWLFADQLRHQALARNGDPSARTPVLDRLASEGVACDLAVMQFASQHPEIPTTLFSSASPESVKRNVVWHEEPYDPALLRAVQRILEPVRDREWAY